jgi:hypothetical protein
MAIVVDRLTSTGHELTIPDGAYTTADDDKSEFDAVSTIETMLRNRISSIEIDANGQRRRILKNHHHNHRHRDAKRKRRVQANTTEEVEKDSLFWLADTLTHRLILWRTNTSSFFLLRHRPWTMPTMPSKLN